MGLHGCGTEDLSHRECGGEEGGTCCQWDHTPPDDGRQQCIARGISDKCCNAFKAEPDGKEMDPNSTLCSNAEFDKHKCHPKAVVAAMAEPTHRAEEEEEAETHAAVGSNVDLV